MKIFQLVRNVYQAVKNKAAATALAVFLSVSGLAGALVSAPAHAVIDVTAVTTGITDAQTAITTIITALLALSVAIYGLVMVYRFVHRKSGA